MIKKIVKGKLLNKQLKLFNIFNLSNNTLINCKQKCKKKEINKIQHILNITCPHSYKISYNFTEHKYKQKTTKQITQQIAEQRWKQMQNTFKSLSTSFGLKKPTKQQLSIYQSSSSALLSKSYPKPKNIIYTLQSLRQVSHSYPIYLHFQLEKVGSGFNKVIELIVDNLWKAQEKEVLEFLEFLYYWDYQNYAHNNININKISNSINSLNNHSKIIDLVRLHEISIQRFDLSMKNLFIFLKRFQGKLHKVIQLKVLQRLRKSDLSSDQYSDLLKIVNYLNVKNMLDEHFHVAVSECVRNNINKIGPSQALQAYVYFTYNINQYVQSVKSSKQNIKKNTQDTQNTNKIDNKESQEQTRQDIGLSILNIIEKRIISQQCIKFYNGEQLVAMLHTFLKNNIAVENIQKIDKPDQPSQFYTKLQKIISRIQLNYYAKDFSTTDKLHLLQISSMLPKIKKQTIIALVQNQLLRNKKSKNDFDYKLLPQLYLISFENGMLTEQLLIKIQDGILQHVFQLQKKEISRALWLFALTSSQNNKNDKITKRNTLNSLHMKIQTIIQGGLNQFKIQDICIIVWSMCSAEFNQNGKFWDNIQSFLHEQLNRLKNNKLKNINNTNKAQIQKITKIQQKYGINSNLVHECSWILWAYHNNRELHIQTLNTITQIIIQQYSQNSENSNAQLKKQMSVFQLTNIITFYYSLVYPSKALQKQIQSICLRQFSSIYQTMEPIQLCKCLKYIGKDIWDNKDQQKDHSKNNNINNSKEIKTTNEQIINNKQQQNHIKVQINRKQISNGVLQIFQTQADKIKYNDIMTIVAVLLASNIKTKRVANIIKYYMERKKRLQSLQDIGQQVIQGNNQHKQKNKQNDKKWKFPI